MKTKYSNYQPLYKLFFLYVFTLGLYLFWWSYKTWKQIKEADFNTNFCKINGKKEMSGNISPIGRTLFLIIPFVNLVILYDLFKAIVSFIKINKIEVRGSSSPGFFLIGFLFFSFMGGGILPLGIIPLLVLQHRFNKTWKKVDERPIKNWPYIFEWVILVLGLIFVFSYVNGV